MSHKFVYKIKDNKKSAVDKKALRLAQKLEKDYSEENIQKIESRKNMYLSKKVFIDIRDKIEYLWKKLKAHETPLPMKIAIFGGFAYLVLPVDIVPDSLPGIGLIDDATVLLAIWKNSLPYFKEVAKDIVDEKGSEYIREKINVSVKEMILRAVFLLSLNIAGTLFACFLPIGELASNLIASGFFLFAIVFSLVRFILFIRKNGKLMFGILKETLKTKNINKGISNYIRNADDKVCKIISNVFKAVEISNKISNESIPELEAVVRHFVRKSGFQLISIFCSYGIYILLVYGVLKPYILKNFAEMNLTQMIFFPFYQLFHLFQSN